MKKSTRVGLDRAGMGASTICAIHCLLTPFLMVILPLSTVAFLESPIFHIGMIVLSLLLAASSFIPSYLKTHRNALPMLLSGTGFLFFAMSFLATTETIEIVLSVIGGLLVVAGHYRNQRLIKNSYS